MSAQSPSEAGAASQPHDATDLDEMYGLLDACAWPLEAFWRSFELAAVKRHRLPRPILGLGCGNRPFAQLTRLRVDEAIDLNPRAVEGARQLAEVYAEVRRADIRELGTSRSGRFASVFANVVREPCATLLVAVKTPE